MAAPAVNRRECRVGVHVLTRAFFAKIPFQTHLHAAQTAVSTSIVSAAVTFVPRGLAVAKVSTDSLAAQQLLIRSLVAGAAMLGAVLDREEVHLPTVVASVNIYTPASFGRCMWLSSPRCFQFSTFLM